MPHTSKTNYSDNDIFSFLGFPVPIFPIYILFA